MPLKILTALWRFCHFPAAKQNGSLPPKNQGKNHYNVGPSVSVRLSVKESRSNYYRKFVKVTEKKKPRLEFARWEFSRTQNSFEFTKNSVASNNNHLINQSTMILPGVPFWLHVIRDIPIIDGHDDLQIPCTCLTRINWKDEKAFN